ncbi:Senescence domain-containing protein [Mycena kentingensis (nom. inval.)]|nr:Senescence domain-containing protein [Mycena kentingensis (nom. inval.)]
MHSEANAFLLLEIDNSTLVSNGVSQTGALGLEIVTLGADEQNVYLVLRMKDTEIPVVPNTVVRTVFTEVAARKYVFEPTDADPLQRELAVSIPLPSQPDAHILENIDTFESILAQYADLQGAFEQATPAVLPNINDKADADQLRGHLVLVDQDNGEVVGEFDKQFTVKEDPELGKKGRENDAVVIELQEGPGYTNDEGIMQLFARAIPPEQQNVITKSATLISHAISGSTTLLLSAISAGSRYYTSNSKSATERAATMSPPPPGTPPPLPARAVSFISSARTRKGLGAMHTVSGQAVKVSAKTVETIDKMIKRAMGNTKPGRVKLADMAAGQRGGSTLEPPPYSAGPPLPPRRTPSPSPVRGPASAPPLPPRAEPSTPAPKLSKTARILLSADLILSTIDTSVKRLLDGGQQNVNSVVTHRYGADAGESSVLMSGTARNVALVYIDLSGIGRRALLRRAGKEFVKGRMG